MPFKTPSFWYPNTSKERKRIKEYVLYPLSAIYRAAHSVNMLMQAEKTVNIPVICIGNMTAGGSGKTPTAIAIHSVIEKELSFKNPCFLTRGYMAQNTETRRIEDHEPVQDTGDEPKILSSHCKTIISKNRYEGAKLALETGHDLIIMDDGYQNHTLKKDVSILVIDGNTGFGNMKTIPSGPLREPLDSGFKKADAIVFIGNDTGNIIRTIPQDIPVFKARIHADRCNINPSTKYLAFCGLATPSKFFDTLTNEKLNIVDHISFPDHHPYTESNVNDLIKKAESYDAKLITTTKDIVKIPRQYHDDIDTLPINLLFDNEQAVASFLKKSLSHYIDIL